MISTTFGVLIVLSVLAFRWAYRIACRRLAADHFGDLMPLPSGSLRDGAAERLASECGTGFSARELRQFRGARR